MMKSYITSAFAGALLLGLATAALAATGEFNNMCTEGLALGKDINTDCSVNTSIGGKTYCFGSEAAKTEFVPADLAAIDQHRQRSRRECFADRADFENRVNVDRIGTTETPDAIATRERDLTVLDGSHRHPRHAGQLHSPLHERIDVLWRIGESRRRHNEEECR
jgi:YHS domain-containing protein